MPKFVPDYIFSKFDDVTPDFLASLGIKGIILDIDNTLEPYEHETPGDHVVKWFEDLKNAGIHASIVSNNNRERVDNFNKNLNLPAYSHSAKPFKKFLLKAMNDMGTNVTNTVFMGDQIFTDILAAHNAGIKGILVPPINDKKDLLTKFKRLLETPIIRKYKKENDDAGI